MVASHEIRQRHPVPVRCELAQLVEIQRDELLDLEDVDPVTQTHVVRQRFRDGEAALSCDEHGAMSGVEILPAPLDALGGQHSRDAVTLQNRSDRVLATPGLIHTHQVRISYSEVAKASTKACASLRSPEQVMIKLARWCWGVIEVRR